jgi:hypothetical protein
MCENELLEMALYGSDEVHPSQKCNQVELSNVVQPINDNSGITDQL